MPTPMNAFAVVASRYGVNPLDDDAVDTFFEQKFPNLDVSEREKIIDELLAQDTVSA